MTTTITNNGLNLVIHRTFSTNPSQSGISRFVVGVSSTAGNATQSSLVQVIPQNTTTFNSCDTTTGWTKAGVGDDVSVLSSTGSFKEGTGCLTLATTDSGTATWYRGEVATDMSGRNLYAYYYSSNVTTNLQNVSDAVSFVLGNNSTTTNSSTYSKHRSQLSDGWNLLAVDTDSATTTSGTPSLATTSYFGITVKANTTISTNDQRMDYWNLCGDSDLYGTFVVGYPSFNTTDKKVTNRAFLSSIQANNFNVKEWAMENSDGTPIMFCRDVNSNGSSKSDTDEFAYIWVDVASQG